MSTQQLSALSEGGLYLGLNPKTRTCYYNAEDTHVLTIGATRSGKSRCIVLQSLGLLAFAGESIVAADPKAELYLYSYPFLQRMGYEVITLDFKNPRRSNRYNFLQPVIDAVNAQEYAKAITYTRDIVASLVSSEQNNLERIWTDGERSMLAAGILSVVVDNQKQPQYQNLTNVYYFLAKMCQPVHVGKKTRLPLNEYMKELAPGHPALAVFDIALIAPEKMRGSFFTSALVTLNLFTDPDIYDMTRTTDFDMHGTGKKKRALFVILPDEKDTYYSIASLFLYQHYQMLVEDSDVNGNRLPVRVNFLCDEFGNFTKIPNFPTMLTVGGGRGVRFNLFVQDFNQIDEKYGDKLGKVIRSNCETWIYLQTDDPDTLKEICGKLGKYTIKSPSLSGSTGGHSSASYNLTGRDLLTPDEIKAIKRPYMLVTSRYAPTIMYAPDISETIFNQLFGLGNKAYNQKLIIRRQVMRHERRAITPQEVQLWGIWNRYIRIMCASSNAQDMIQVSEM